MKLPRPRLSYANVVATLALFIALGGGAYAATQLPANSVKAPQIAANAVGTSELRGGAVRPSDVSQKLATSLQKAITNFEPPRGEDACEILVKGIDGCVNVKGETRTLGLLASHAEKLTCPSGDVILSGQHFAVVIGTASPHYSGYEYWSTETSLYVVFTNWSQGKYEFTPVTACGPRT